MAETVQTYLSYVPGDNGDRVRSKQTEDYQKRKKTRKMKKVWLKGQIVFSLKPDKGKSPRPQFIVRE